MTSSDQAGPSRFMDPMVHARQIPNLKKSRINPAAPKVGSPPALHESWQKLIQILARPCLANPIRVGQL